MCCQLKQTILFSLAAAAVAAARAPIDQDNAGNPVLRRELARLLESGQVEQAVERAQTALRQAPDDLAVRQEFISLHLALAREWLGQRRYDDCLAAVGAILVVKPDHAAASAIRRQVLEAREAAGRQAPEIDRLLRLELHETALERIREVKSLRPDEADAMASRERAAWLGAADDHYLARNFSEALALYEHVFSTTADWPAALSQRWLLCLALALSESEATQPIPPELSRRLLERASSVPAGSGQALLPLAIKGLLAEQADDHIPAGQAYADALDVRWQLPPSDQRRSAVAHLRRQVVDRLHALYDQNHQRVREGAWRIVLPGVWKHRQSEHFDVYARNDLVAERVTEAAEFHLAGLAAWLEVPCPEDWKPRCELRIHATLGDLHEATDTRGVTRALTRIRVQGDRVLQRSMNLFQNDAWLLASTIPHELTHILLAEAHRSGKLPLALDEGLALQAEPPARRLQFRRLLRAPVPDATELLAAKSIPEDELTFYARCDAFTSFLLYRSGVHTADDPRSSPISSVLDAFGEGRVSRWWSAFGWESEASMQGDWSEWHVARRGPPRMPLMILATRPASQGGERD